MKLFVDVVQKKASPSTEEVKFTLNDVVSTLTIEALKKHLIVDHLKLSTSMNLKYLKLYGNEKELFNEQTLGHYDIHDETTLILIIHEDAYYDIKVRFAHLKSLTEIFNEIEKYYKMNMTLISEIESVKEVKQFKYRAEYNLEESVSSTSGGGHGSTSPISSSTTSPWIKANFKIVEETVEIPTVEIFEAFKTDETMTTINDHFNDKICYNPCQTLADIKKLNEVMLHPLQKYCDLFEPTNTRIMNILLMFADNYFIIHRNLHTLKDLVTDAPSRLADLQKHQDIVNEQFTVLEGKDVKFSEDLIPLVGSAIVSKKEAHTVHSLVGTSTKFSLLYRSSRDGKDAAAFHRLCDNQGGTLTLVKDSGGYIFGGFSTQTWNQSTTAYVGDPSAFLFTITNPHGIAPTKYLKNTSTTNGIYNQAGYGPTFGGGHDLHIANNHSGSYSGLGNSYTDTTGKGANTFTGASSFTPVEVEVWKCVSAGAFKGSVIVDSSMASSIQSFLPSLSANPSLLYRSTRDGKEAVAFHRLCDNQGSTITLIKDIGGYVFGGFTASSWKSAVTSDNDSSAFLFSLKNPRGAAPTKYVRNTSNYAIYSNPNYGPTFGGGHDIYVDASHTSGCYLNFPNSYTDTTGVGRNTFTGNYNFTPAEVEVWRV
jgi:hypothetical protein